ncbi:MAG TPA: hypothetical protein VHN37_13185 [Actinomycetota bacterium]|nr:hypothetical protein [Actinomycetota bacterium]
MPDRTRAPSNLGRSTDFTVEGKHLELDGKFTNYSRGACDPAAGSCPPPVTPASSRFLVRGECTRQATPR